MNNTGSPDKNCVTLPDGSCVGSRNCIHDLTGDPRFEEFAKQLEEQGWIDGPAVEVVSAMNFGEGYEKGWDDGFDQGYEAGVSDGILAALKNGG